MLFCKRQLALVRALSQRFQPTVLSWMQTYNSRAFWSPYFYFFLIFCFYFNPLSLYIVPLNRGPAWTALHGWTHFQGFCSTTTYKNKHAHTHNLCTFCIARCRIAGQQCGKCRVAFHVLKEGRYSRRFLAKKWSALFGSEHVLDRDISAPFSPPDSRIDH